MKIFESERDSIEDIERALTTGVQGPSEDLERTVRGIIADVRKRGDAAVLELGRRFDSPSLDSLEVTEAEFDAAYVSVRPEFLKAIRTANSNI
jgi:histidinol dehydrogenase